MLRNKGNIIFALTVLLVIGLACGMLDQTAEANKFVDEANILIGQNNDRVIKSSRMFTELFSTNLVKVTNVEKYKKENKVQFEELIALSGEIEKNGAELIGKFEQALKLKIGDKYKQYLELKIQEHKKRMENEKLVIPFIKAFLETKDTNKINEQIDEYNNRSVQITKESHDLMDKADQIVKENPDLIK